MEYDGTDFSGWQWQPNVRTVQAVVEGALKEMLRETPRVVASGRTDAGVHALAQVVNFRTERSINPESLRRGLNSLLPRDVVVKDAEEVDDGFHARYDAVKRQYRYVIAKRMRALGRQYAWFCKYNLDLQNIRRASEYLIGEHVFSAFSRAIVDEKHYICNVKSIDWQESGDDITFEICANRFLHNMVRIIVGTLVEVGRGQLTANQVEQILQSRDRNMAGLTVPPHGLFLKRVFY